MKRILQGLLLVALLVAPGAWLQAEKVADLPKPTGYVSDFAGVLSPADPSKSGVPVYPG